MIYADFEGMREDDYTINYELSQGQSLTKSIIVYSMNYDAKWMYGTLEKHRKAATPKSLGSKARVGKIQPTAISSSLWAPNN